MSETTNTKFIPVPRYDRKIRYKIPGNNKRKIYHLWDNLGDYFQEIKSDSIDWWEEDDGTIKIVTTFDESGFKTKYEYLLKFIKIYNILVGLGWDPEVDVRQQIDNRPSTKYKDEDGNYIMMYLWMNYSKDQIEAQNPQFKKEVFVIDGIPLTYYSFGVTSLDRKPVITNEVKTYKVEQTPKKGAMLYEAPKGSITRKNEKGEDVTWYDWDTSKLEKMTIKDEDKRTFDDEPNKTYYRFGHCTVPETWGGHEYTNIGKDTIMDGFRKVGNGQICVNGEPSITFDMNATREDLYKNPKLRGPKFIEEQNRKGIHYLSIGEPFMFITDPSSGKITSLGWILIVFVVGILVAAIIGLVLYFRKRGNGSNSQETIVKSSIDSQEDVLIDFNVLDVKEKMKGVPNKNQGSEPGSESGRLANYDTQVSTIMI